MRSKRSFHEASRLHLSIPDRSSALWLPMHHGELLVSECWWYSPPMKIFVCSMITGMEPLRDAAQDAIESLGHEAIMAEGFSAMPTSPQKACLISDN
jgi:hypothetical protein